MKVKSRQINSILDTSPDQYQAALIYGPDSGLIVSYAERLCRSIVSDLLDPFSVTELGLSVLQQHPGRLLEEAMTLTYSGNRHLIRVRQADDSVVSAFDIFFKNCSSTSGFIVAEAEELSVRSRLRILFEAAPSGLAIPCYIETGAGLTSILANMARERGIILDSDAAAYLAMYVVGNRAIAASELDKIALYIVPAKHATLQDVMMICGDSAKLTLDEPGLAAADNDVASLDRSFARLMAEGHNPIAILRTTQHHFQRLHKVAVAYQNGTAIATAVANLKPIVFFKLRDRLIKQGTRWSVDELSTVLQYLIKAEERCKRTAMPAREICAMVLLDIALRTCWNSYHFSVL